MSEPLEDRLWVLAGVGGIPTMTIEKAVMRALLQRVADAERENAENERIVKACVDVDLSLREEIAALRSKYADLERAARTTRLICWATSGAHIEVGAFADMPITDDGSLWHDHSPFGGDIVCTGPFSLALRALGGEAAEQKGTTE